MMSLTGFWSSAPTTVQNPLPPNVMVPRQISETNNPVLPSWLYFMEVLRFSKVQLIRVGGRGCPMKACGGSANTPGDLRTIGLVHKTRFRSILP